MEVHGQPHHLLYPWGKRSQYPLNGRLDRLQSWSGHSGKEGKIPAPAENRTHIIVLILAELSQM